MSYSLPFIPLFVPQSQPPASGAWILSTFPLLIPESSLTPFQGRIHTATSATSYNESDQVIILMKPSVLPSA